MSEQKPDQWQKRHPVRTMGKWENTHEHDAKWWRDNSSGWEIRALYAAQPAQPVETLPLDYVQGFRDGLEWAADLAEAEDPRTSDWMYDDPHDLAEAIRRGPEMPPAQAQPARLSDGDIARHWFATTEEDEIWPSAVKFAHAIAAAVVPPGFVVVKDWQPIETAPKDGATVIVGRDMGDFGFIRGYARWEGEGHVAGWISCGFDPISSNLGLAHPTHWMPLPSAPKATK